MKTKKNAPEAIYAAIIEIQRAIMAGGSSVRLTAIQDSLWAEYHAIVDAGL